MKDFEILIIGAGVTGLALARALALQGKKGLAVLDKEADAARHASGRNSGVVHAGYNPKPGTLKARLCVEGNRRMKEHCRAKGVPLVESGILIVARDAGEIPRLEELLRRGQANGVPGLRIVEGRDIPSIEPNAQGLAALHAPSGASVDAKAFVGSLAEEAKGLGLELLLGRRVEAIEETAQGFAVRSGDETFRCGRLVNCAGAHADQVAHSLGAGLDYALIPIRGEYRRLRPEAAGLVRSMIYPVPDPEFPFLGVHWTKTAHGEVLIGPNAVPALGREAYAWGESSLRGALELALQPRAWKLLGRPGTPGLLWEQLNGSLRESEFIRQARSLVPAARREDFLPGPSGIRAQLVDRDGRMVEDLLVESKGNALHVLNVVSPGLTCSLAFAEYLAQRLG